MTDRAILAYLAGIIDGEGTVGIYSRGGARRGEYQFHMSVVNTHEPTLHLLREHLGGTVRSRPTNTGRLGKKPIWVWQHRGDGAWDAYYKVEPYLRIKRWKQEPK